MTQGDNHGTMVAIGEARNVLPGIPSAPVATQTHEIGVIVPPPDIRAILDKTAQFVAKNGVAFEQRILANEAENKKFNFLKPNDPYNPYYKKRVEHFKAPPVDTDEKGELAPPPEQQQQQEAVTAPPTLTTTVVDKLQAPDPELFTVKIPEGLALEDVDIIQLTAQYAARNGKQSFLTRLAAREHNNPRFQFIKPTHSLFAFFKNLCDSYTEVLVPKKSTLERLKADAKNRSGPLERALHRMEWERVQEKESKEKADEAEREREAMMSIDWHDFAVVEVIDFFRDEEAGLPLPTTKHDFLLALRAAVLEGGGEEDGNKEEEKMEIDENEAAMIAEGQAARRMPPPPPPPPAAALAPPAGSDEDEDEEAIKAPIIKNYTRRSAKQQAAAVSSKHVVSPITGELIPINEMAEHMRISLIDPKWREQREIALAKIKETTKASDDDVWRHLTMLAKKRPEVFSSKEEMNSVMVEQIQNERAEQGGDRGGEVEEQEKKRPRRG